MKKQETKESSARKLFIDNDVIYDLSAIGMQGILVGKMMEFNDVYQGVKCLNILALNERMYPILPFLPLSFGGLEDTRCVIVGGMPVKDKLESWTGSGYSYTIPNHRSVLHQKIIDDIHGTAPFRSNVEQDFGSLQDDGILLLHEVMSTTEEHMTQCKEFWQPIIFRLLNAISVMSPDVPIVFATRSAMLNFKCAVLGSNNTFCLGLSGNDSVPANPVVFELVQDIVNYKQLPNARINFMTEITKL